MDFYNESARMIATEICKALKDSPVSQGAKLVEMHKMMMRFDDISIDCASKLAPYQTPKLESLEINKKSTTRFVIQAPQVVKDTHSWLAQVKQEALPAPNNGNLTVKAPPKAEIIIPEDDIEDIEDLNLINGKYVEAKHG